MTRNGRARPSATRPAPAGGEDDGLFPRTLGGFKWALLTAGGQALLSLLIVMTLARLLTPEHFGQLATALIFLTLADAVGRRGLGPAIIQRFELTGRHIGAGFTLSLIIGAALGAGLWALAPWLGWLTGDPLTGPMVRALSLATVVAGAGVVSEYRLRRELCFRKLMGAALLSQGIGSGLVPVALALMGHGVWALVWGVVARQAVFTLTVMALRPPPPRLAVSRREAAELLRTGAGFSALALFKLLSGQSLNLLIARTLGAAPLGLFTRARSLSVVPARLGPVLSNVLLPAMARRQRRIDRLRVVLLNGTELLSLAALPASLMMAVCAPEIVGVVLGARWEAAAPALRILALVGALQSLNALHVPVIRAVGAVYRETWRRALYLALLLGGAWFGSRRGLTGVVAAVAAARVVQHGLLTHLALGLLGLGWATTLRRHLPALWAGAWATAALSLAAGLARGAGWASAPVLALEMAVGSAAVLAAVYFAPPFARPAFPHWGLDRLPFDTMGPSGRWARYVLEHLARRWPDRHAVAAP